jgi:hypothetical protein
VASATNRGVSGKLLMKNGNIRFFKLVKIGDEVAALIVHDGHRNAPRDTLPPGGRRMINEH